MGDLDIDLKDIFPVTDETMGEREFIVERKWMALRYITKMLLAPPPNKFISSNLLILPLAPHPHRCSKPGPLAAEAAKTAADLKRAAFTSGGMEKNAGYGHVLLSFIFRPADPPANAANFKAELGNRE